MPQSRFFFPAAWALGAHALLFIPSRDAASTLVAATLEERMPPPKECVLEVVEPTPPSTTDETADPAAESTPVTGEIVPRSPEPPPSPIDGSITLEGPPVVSAEPIRPISTIPPGLPAIKPGIPSGGGPSPRSPIWDGTKLDATPRALRQTAPQYPTAARQLGLRGEVWVEFVVDERGHVIAPRVTRASHPDFESAALRAVIQWRFEPGKKDGRIVRFRLSQPLVFTLSE